ncbi:hypothetical protein ACROYT_G039076 [Oculina patagonica]
MATLFLRMAVFQLLFLWKPLIVEGSNSSVLLSNATNPTSSNGISNQLTNITNTSSNPVASTHAPTTHRLTTATINLTQSGIVPLKSGKSSSAAMSPTVGENGVQSEQPKSTKPVNVVGVSSPANQNDDGGDIPFWVYILIGVGLIFIIAIIVCLIYTKVDRWKNHGSYMVWDDNELELSPAFTRESEFLLDNLATNQEPGTPELQIYEIPLDSLGHQRVYIGTKRIAPKTDERKEAVRFSKNKKSRKKDGLQFQGNTLPRTGRRDHIYSSVNDEVSSTLSEGDLFEGRNVNGHTVPAVLLSSQNLGKNGKPMINGSSSPEEIERELRSLTLGCRTKSVSNIFQNRPLPPAPSKRFSKSLDRLRFFETSPNNKGKGKTFPYHQKSPPIRAHPVLVKSSSFGGTFNKIISGSVSQPPVPPPRKNSMEFQDKSATFDMGHVRRTNLCHRHSKSLDTLLLLRDMNWTAFDVDIYHSYESVHGSQLGENNNVMEPSYASVTSDEKPPSRESSGRASSQSKASTMSGSPIDSDTPLDDGDEDHPYASVSEEERSVAGSFNGSNRESDVRDSGVSAGLLEADSDPTSPYASVRISQIPGLVTSQYHSSPVGEDSDYSGGAFEKEDSGLSIGTCKDLRECVDSKRASTHTYLELFPDNVRDSVISETSLDKKEDEKRASTHTYLELLPDSGRDSVISETSPDKKQDDKRASTHTYLEILPDNNRDSVISETSSGYARPIDVVLSKPETSDNKDLDNERRTSLTDLEIPNVRSGTLESTDSGNGTLCAASDFSLTENEGNIPLVSDKSNSQRDENGSMNLKAETSPRMSQLSFEGLQDNDEDDNVADTKGQPEDKGAPSTGEHIYVNTGFIENLRNQNSEQSEPMKSDADVNVNVQAFGLKETCHTDEFVV